MSPILCDLGGTNCRFAMVGTSGEFDPASVRPMRNDGHDSFLTALRAYCRDADIQRVERLVVAVAAPANEDEIRLTNRDWRLSKTELRKALDGAGIDFINDLQAIAFGLAGAASDGRLVHKGSPDAGGASLVVNVGTGFNTAVLPAGGRPLACEAGHATFPVETDFDRRLQTRFTNRFGRCSLDRILSGSGLVAIHQELCAANGWPVTRSSSEEIVSEALEVADSPAGATCGEFCRILGRTAGDLGLTFLATGGIWITGGLGRALAPLLGGPDSAFLSAFRAKGRMSEMVETLPIHVIESEDVALRGCLHWMLAEQSAREPAFPQKQGL